MKKKYCLLALAAMTLMGCGGSGAGSKGSRVAFESVRVDKSVPLDNEADAPQCTVHLELAEAKDGPAQAVNAAVIKRVFDMEELTMQQAADSFATSYCRGYVQNFRPLYREDKDAPEKRSWYDYHYTVTTQTDAGRDGVVVYTAVIDYYEGGAHGLNLQLLMNFDTTTGQELTLDDVFVAGYEGQLSELLQKKLQEQTNTKSLDELREQGYLYSMAMFPSQNFALTDDGIRFVYNVYEIAPYAMGLIELTVSYSEVKGIMK